MSLSYTGPETGISDSYPTTSAPNSESSNERFIPTNMDDESSNSPPGWEKIPMRRDECDDSWWDRTLDSPFTSCGYQTCYP
jgi:hypothetical protein